MKRIAIRSNHTRAEERPPLRTRPVDADLLAQMGFQRSVRKPKPTEAKGAAGKTLPQGKNHPSEKRLLAGKKQQPGASAPGPKAPGTVPPRAAAPNANLPAQKRPANSPETRLPARKDTTGGTAPDSGGNPPAKVPPATQQPAPRVQPPAAPSASSPLRTPPGQNQPRSQGQAWERPSQRSDNPSQRNGSSQGDSSSQRNGTSPRNGQSSSDDAPRRYDPSHRYDPPRREEPARRDAPLEHYSGTVKPRDSRVSPADKSNAAPPPSPRQPAQPANPADPKSRPGSSAMPGNSRMPGSSELPGDPARPGLSRSEPEKPTQPGSQTIKSPGSSGTAPNGNGFSGRNGISQAPNGASPNGVNGKNGSSGTNGANGSSGTVSRSTLFRPSAFSAMPAVRIPPKALEHHTLEHSEPENPTAEKPETPGPRQLPLDPPRRPDAPERSTSPLSQRPANPDPPPTNPEPPARIAPSLQQILKQNAGLPDQAAVLGVCDDGLPMLLDLYDPAPGALVVIGDEREQQLEILHAAVASLAGRNSPRKVQFLILSCDVPSWETWIREKGYDRYCLGIQGVEEEVVREWIIRLADWTEQRRTGQSSGPSVVLVMDTLSFLPALSYDIRLNFEWMAKEGPLAQIWPLAAISTDLAKMLNGRRMLRAFQTRIIGYANNPADYVLLAGLDEQKAAGFGRRGNFAVRVGENWLRFKLLSS